MWPVSAPSGLPCPYLKQGYLRRRPLGSFWFGHSTMPASSELSLLPLPRASSVCGMGRGLREPPSSSLSTAGDQDLVSSFPFIPMLTRMSWSRGHSFHHSTHPQGKSPQREPWAPLAGVVVLVTMQFASNERAPENDVLSL